MRLSETHTTCAMRTACETQTAGISQRRSHVKQVSQTVFYTAKVGGKVELFQIALDEQPVQLTASADGTLHYHPKTSSDGNGIVYGSKRDGIPNLYAMRLSDHKEHALTAVRQGHAAMHANWQPCATED